MANQTFHLLPPATSTNLYYTPHPHPSALVEWNPTPHSKAALSKEIGEPPQRSSRGDTILGRPSYTEIRTHKIQRSSPPTPSNPPCEPRIPTRSPPQLSSHRDRSFDMAKPQFFSHFYPLDLPPRKPIFRSQTHSARHRHPPTRRRQPPS